MQPIQRRVFVKGGAIALLALGLPPSFLARAAAARTSTRRRKTLVFVFQRGAVDGLSMVVPFGDRAYYEARKSIAIETPGGTDGSAIDLDGFFGLHPALAPLHEIWGREELAIVHASGSPHPTRSHFDAQDFIESGTPGVRSTADGWANRLLATNPGCDCGRTLDDPVAHANDHADAQSSLATSPLRGVSLTPETPLMLRGATETVAIPDLAHFGVAGGREEELERTFERLYRAETGDLVAAAEGSFDAIELLRSANPTAYRPRNGADYPMTDFGRSLLQIAQLIKADVGVEIAFTDIGGWDTHVGQGGSSGRLAARLGELSRGLRAFYDDLGDLMEDVLVVSVSEFGRTVAENGSGGTDHGHGNCMLVLGGAASGGQVVGRWPGLDRDQLYQGRDLEITTDFRDVFAEVASKHLGASELGSVFPGHTIDPARFPGLLR